MSRVVDLCRKSAMTGSCVLVSGAEWPNRSGAVSVGGAGVSYSLYLLMQSVLCCGTGTRGWQCPGRTAHTHTHTHTHTH